MKMELQTELLKDAIRAASEHFNIVPAYIEKDYWICKILQRLSRSIYADCAVFKGGTSLSKGYGLINRFSEDIDIAILTDNLSGNQIKTLISKIDKEITKNLQEQNIPELTSKGSRYRKTIYQYSSSVNNLSPNFAANRIILEINSFANPCPYTKQEIKSFITSYMEDTGMQHLINEYDMQPFILNVLDKRQTLCEKTVSLLRFSFADNPIEELSNKIRHFYDIYCLLNDAKCADYIENNFIKDVTILIKHDKETFNIPKKWKMSPIQESPLLNSFDKLWDKLGGIYETELNALAYSKIPSKIDVKNKIKDFFIRIKSCL